MQQPAVNQVAEYMMAFPPETVRAMEQVRAAILEAAPGATESISYRMPAYRLDGPLVYFAAYRNHIGFYPMPSAIEAFRQDLSVYKCAKGSVQFPLNKPMPLKLIARMVAFRVAENREASRLKKNRGT